ncbi:MAG: hypothetical protein RSA79_03210 [Oscillospiraceae bacterium]
MEKSKIIETINLEEQKLLLLKSKRTNLDVKIKQKQALIDNQKELLEHKKFNEATDVLVANNLTLEEIMQAIKNGDVLSLQEKIDQKTAK